MNRLLICVALLVTVLATGAGADHPGGLVAFYRFDQPSSEWSRDASCRGHALPFYAGWFPNYGAGYEGTALTISGSGSQNDTIDIPVDLNPSHSPQLTIGAWVKADVASGSRQAIISHDNGDYDRGLLIEPGSPARWATFTGSGVLTGTSVTVGQWTFVAAVYDQVAGTLRLRIGGSTYYGSTSFGSGYTTARIGSNPGFGEFLDGSIDNAFVFDRALSNTELNTIANGGAAGVLTVAAASLSGGEVRCEQKYDETRPSMVDLLDLSTTGRFGTSVAGFGDLDGDGKATIYVGAPFDAAGSVFNFEVDANRRPANFSQPTSHGQSSLAATSGDLFGFSLAPLGDLDGDGTPELLIGAPRDDDGGTDRGAVWIAEAYDGGGLGTFAKISDANGLGLADDDVFGKSVTSLGDVNGDGVVDIAVGANDDPSGLVNAGSVYILFLNNIGGVESAHRISHNEGGFGAFLDAGDQFGNAVAALGDLDGNGVSELAVGAPFDDFASGDNHGAVYVLFLQSDGTIDPLKTVKIGDGSAGISLAGNDYFGTAVGALGDLNGDGITDLGVGAYYAGPQDRGAMYVLFMNADGTVMSHTRVADGEGSFVSDLFTGDHFGRSVAAIGDLDGDGIVEVAVGADRAGPSSTGALFLLSLEGVPVVCGNGLLQPPLEECDDGNAVPADGCSACTVDDVIELFGGPEGGDLLVTISGVELSFVTANGDTLQGVIAALVDAINSDVTLQGLGVVAVVQGSTVVTNGEVSGVTSSDPGLATTPVGAALDRRIPYQGRLADAAGPVTLLVELYDAPVGGTRVFGPEQHDVTPDAQGRFAIPLGDTGSDRCRIRSDGLFDCLGADGVPDLDRVDTDGPLYLEVRLVEGGATTSLTPRQRLYPAFHAETTATLVPGSVGLSSLAQSVARRLVPPGTVLPFAGSAQEVPAGWLLCDGSAYPESFYPELAALLEPVYGSPAAGQFLLPDYRGYFLRGHAMGLTSRDPDAGSRTANGSTQGDATGPPTNPFSINSTGAHTHTVPTQQTISAALSNPTSSTFGGSGGNVPTDSAGAHLHTLETSSTETHPTNVSVNFIIKH